MFRSEVRFYREIAPEVGVRVPACYRADESAEGFVLELEDLSAWTPGGDPVALVYVLRAMHARWQGIAEGRWQWLRRIGAAADLIGAHFDRTWPTIAARADLTPAARALGERFIGQVARFEREEGGAGALTLVHGDASLNNVRTSPGGEIVVLDWEDVRLAPGIVDLVWLLVSSVPPAQWVDVREAYGATTDDMLPPLPTALGQGLLSLADTEDGSPAAAAWIHRIEAGATLLRH